jgi:hypothetical protein
VGLTTPGASSLPIHDPDPKETDPMTTTSTYLLVDDAGYGWCDPIEARDDAHAHAIAEAEARRIAAESFATEPHAWTAVIDLYLYRRLREPSEDEDPQDVAEDIGRIRVVVDPPEPTCVDRRADHEWRQVGVSGSDGGGVQIEDRCERCGVRRLIDTTRSGPGGERYRAECYPA